MTKEIIEHTFDIAGRASVSTSNIRGSIVVQRGDAGVVAVKAVKHTNTGDAERTNIHITQDEDGLVHAEVKFKEEFFGMLSFLRGSRPCKVELTITVPPTCDLDAKAISSSLSVTGLAGDLKLDAVSGDISLDDLAGTLKLHTVSGDVSGKNITAPVKFNTVSGDVQLELGQAVEGDTVSGDIAITSPMLGEGPYRFKSVSGDVHLALQAGSPATVHFSSVSGSFKVPEGTSRHERSGGPGSKRHRVEIDGGGTEVHVKSVSGDLHLDAPGSATASQPAKETAPTAEAPETAPPEPAPPEPGVPEPEEEASDYTTRELLELIESGEMSVEDVIRTIEE